MRNKTNCLLIFCAVLVVISLLILNRKDTPSDDSVSSSNTIVSSEAGFDVPPVPEQISTTEPKDGDGLSSNDLLDTQWSGYYDAMSNSDIIKRHMDMYIGNIDENGDFNGVANILTGKTTDSFAISGHINYQNGDIIIYRGECLDDNSQNLNPITFVGTIDTTSIKGNVDGQTRKISLKKSNDQIDTLRALWETYC